MIELLYFDTYNAHDPRVPLEPPEISEQCFTLIPRTRTRALDDKAEMARTLMAEGVPSPRVYFAVDAVPHEPDSLWFVKQPNRSGGKGIVVATMSDLEKFTTDRVIIQEAIQDLALIEGRKFTLRLYVLVAAGKLYLYQDGFMVLHARPYEKGSTDPMVQFVHDGYMDPGSGIELRLLRNWSAADKVLEHAAGTLTASFRAFTNRLKHERRNHYCLFGVDLLVTESLRCVLVEINDRPNLVHSSQINEKVNVPMLAAMAGILNPDWGSQDSLSGRAGHAGNASREFSLLASL